MNEIKLQKNSQSLIYRYSLVMAVLEAVLGVLCVLGYMDNEMMGALLIALAPLTQWVAANNPSMANQYQASAEQVAEQNEEHESKSIVTKVG